MQHTIITLAAQALLIWAGVDAWAAGAIPAALYLGREHAQAEQRIIESSFGRRALAPWWAGFTPAAWNGKSLADALLPALAAALVAFVRGVI